MLHLEKDTHKARLILTGMDLDKAHKEKLIFLGDWVNTHLDKIFDLNQDSVLVPNPWDDREKLFKDHDYLEGLYAMEQPPGP